MAKAADQFQARDVTFWGILVLAVWGFALASGTIVSFLPEGVLGGLHASRLDGASLNQLRGQVAQLQAQAAELKQANSQLQQRFMLTEQSGTEVTKRVGALELTLPNILETLNKSAASDNSIVTGSTGANPVTLDADGGTVSYTTVPLSSVADPNASQKTQPMPQALPSAPRPSANSFGVALGPPIGAADASAAWQGINAKVGTLLLGLEPVLGHVEGGAGRRLVAGPIASEADARDLCGRMAKVGIACASVPFLGDPMPTN